MKYFLKKKDTGVIDAGFTYCRDAWDFLKLQGLNASSYELYYQDTFIMSGGMAETSEYDFVYKYVGEVMDWDA